MKGREPARRRHGASSEFRSGDRVDRRPGSSNRPGPRRVRALLEAAPESGWADPEIRSIWPGRMPTNWVEVEIVRR